MKIVRKIIEIDEEKCDGCGNCVIGCAEGALAIVDGKAKVLSDNLCDGLGACIGECPQDALKIIEREAAPFDEEAVEEHLAGQQETVQEAAKMACGCPSTQIQSLTPCAQANQPCIRSASRTRPSPTGPSRSDWCHPTHTFLKGADLLVAADCVPVAFPSFHQDLLQGKTVMLGCPKFDDVQPYVEKFAAIFKTAGIRSVTIAVMEVPCCAGLPKIVQKGMDQAGVNIPFDLVVVSTRGRILETRKVA